MPILKEVDVRIATICDFAHMDERGRLTVFNAYTRLTVGALPYQRPRFAIAVWLSPDPGFSQGQHTFVIRILDPSETELVRVDGEMGIRNRDGGDGGISAESMVPIVGEISPLEVKSYGRHVVEVSLDGTTVCQIPFSVVAEKK